MIQKSIHARSVLTGFVLLFSILGVFARPANPPLACSISGPTTSCVNQLEYYYTNPVPGFTYTWQVPAGGALSNTTGASAMVNWTAAGTQQVILTETDQGGLMSFCTLYVSVNPRPNPKIFTDFISDCQEPPQEEAPAAGQPKDRSCWLVCEQMTVNYWTTPEPGQTYQWTFVGGSPSTATGASVSTTWGSTGPGSVILTATGPGGCSESVTQCVTIIASPKAAFTFNNQSPDSPLKICLGETVYFSDLSQGASHWFWDFGDGSTSNLQNPTHNYGSPGVYSGSLTIKNNCGCEDVLSFEVIVNKAVSPEIGCISTLCLGECAFYTVTNINNCPNATLDWRIFGGKLMSAPVNGSINVIWDDNDSFIDQNGYGMICVRVSGCEGLCDGEICVRVPIIHKARIMGPTDVCAGEQVTYYLPTQPGINETGLGQDGVDFDWVVTGGDIISTFPYGNTIVVTWFNTGSGTVAINGYENYLGDPTCQFDPDPLGVNIRPTFSISPTETSACVGQTQTITSNGAGSFNWTVSGPGGNVGPIPGGNTYTVALPLAGTYIVTAESTSGAYCPMTPSAVIVAKAPPPAPTGTINGTAQVCANTPYTYSMSTPPPAGSIYVWSATNGTVYGAGGQTVSVEWSGIPPMTLSVRTKSNQEPFCESDNLDLNVQLYTPPSVFINGPAAVCSDQTETFDALALTNYTDIQWSIVPAIAGSVVSGQGSQTVNVLFNTSTPSSVQIVATATVCGIEITDTKTVAVNQIPAVSLIAPTSVCNSDFITLSVSPTVGIVSYLWDFGDGSTSTDAVPVHSWTTAGSYPVSVQLVYNICGNPTVTLSTTVLVNPKPVANITASNGFSVCPSLGLTTDLIVSTQFACTYQWSIPGAFGPVVTVSTAGVYCVTATEPGTGCATVNCVNIEDCDIINPCFSAYDPWSFVAVEDCDTYTFFPIPTGADFWKWEFGDGTQSFDPSVVSHTYAHVGYYDVTLFSIDPITLCTLSYTQKISVKFKGDFSATFDCSSGSMITTLTDRSEYLPGFAVTPTWFDGTASVGTGSVLTQNWIPGIHSVYLEVNILGMVCQSPFQNVEVPGMPQAIIGHNAPQCEGQPVQFVNNSTGGGLTGFSWNFGDGATSGLENTERVYYTPPNDYTVTLTVANDWGCSASSSVLVSILDKGPDPLLSLSPTPPVCEGTAILITAAPTLTLPVSYTWYNVSAPSVPLQGPSASNTFTANSNGLYGVSISDGNGCQYNVLAPESVVITPPPYVNIIGNTNACVGDAFNLSADIGTGFNYQWLITFPDLSTQPRNGSTISVFANQSGLYSFAVTITDPASGCTNTGSTSGTAHSGVTDLSILASGSCAPAQLLATGTGIVNYNWSEGTTTQQMQAAVGGEYAVVVSDQWGCTSKESYFLGSKPDLSNVMTGCYEFCNGVVWQAPNCSGCQYQWTFNGNPLPGETNATIRIKVSGVYTVIVTNSYGCQSESEAIEISVVKEPDYCAACDIKITKGRLVCRGSDPATGQRIYEFWLDVFNNGGALNGVTVQSNLGTVNVDVPPNGFIPGGGVVTQVHGTLVWNGSSDNGCFDLLGYLTKDCSDPTPCTARWCGELPPCCNGICALEVTEVKAVCLTKGHYRVSGTVTNNGCDLFNMYVHTAFGNYPLNPSTILAGNSVTYSAIIAIPPGTYGFQICGTNASGELCCKESSIKVPNCDVKEPCPLEVAINQFVCVGLTPDGLKIYNFQLSVFGVPFGYNLEIVPQQFGYFTNLSYTCLGGVCTISGTYYHVPNSAGICLSILALSSDEPPQVCLGQICLDEPKCFFRGQKSDARNANDTNPGLEGQDFSLIPNPATRAVQVWFSDETDTPFEVCLTDLYGRQLQVTQNVIEGGVQLDLSTQASGVYIVTLKKADGTLSSKKLVVENNN